MAKKPDRVFFAYPAQPIDIRATIESAAADASTRATSIDVRTWPAASVVGAHIADKVRNEISTSRYLVADVTVKNPNVYYEIGFAIGQGIPILPVVNRSHADAQRRLQSEGYFDNIKFEPYDNTEQLSSILRNFHGTPLLDVYSRDINVSQPLYILDTQIKTDFRNQIVSAVKDAKVFFRTFDPVETPRFSTVKVISEATSSVAAVLPLLAPHLEDAEKHNLRASFVAGLMHGLSRPVLLVQNFDGPIPLDFREDVQTHADLNELALAVDSFATDSVKRLQSNRAAKGRENRTPVQNLWMGASAAENEFRVLSQYFLQTSEYIRTIKGDGKIVTGRKGSGKTAIFFMARDHFRATRGNIVVDLKPESHELIELRELLTEFSTAGVVSHTFAGFWYVLLLIEVALKFSDELRLRGVRNHKAFIAAEEIQAELDKFGIPAKADFTSRLKLFVQRITAAIQYELQKGGNVSLEKLTNFVFGNEQRSLRQVVAKHVGDGRIITVLFDNLDKGWPATGVDPADVMFVRSLIDSLNRLQRDLSADDVDFRFSIFIRNDIYELMLENTSDRGKDAAIPIDWSDREKLRAVIQRRIAVSAESSGDSASWDGYFSAKVGGQDALDYVIDHCLMRPRFLIDIVERSISFAINRLHSSVSSNDIEDAVRQHSYSLVDDFGFEIRDATGLAHEILDAFIGCSRELSEQEVLDRVTPFSEKAISRERIVELLIWYGFLGIKLGRRERYVYDFNYSLRRMEAEIRNGGAVVYVVNPAFYVGLAN